MIDGWIFYFDDKQNSPFIVWSREAAEIVLRDTPGITVRPFVFVEKDERGHRLPASAQ